MCFYYTLFLLRILSLQNLLEIQEIDLTRLLAQVKTRLETGLETEAPAPSTSAY